MWTVTWGFRIWETVWEFITDDCRLTFYLNRFKRRFNSKSFYFFLPWFCWLVKSVRTISEHQWYQWGEDPKRHPPSHAVCSDSEVPLDCRAASFHRLWDSMTDSSWWWWCPEASNCSPAVPRSHSSSHWKLSGYGRRTHSCSLQNECAEDRHRVCLKLVYSVCFG